MKAFDEWPFAPEVSLDIDRLRIDADSDLESQDLYLHASFNKDGRKAD